MTRPGGEPLVPEVQVLGDALLLRGPAVLETLTAYGVLVRQVKANGAQPSSRLLGMQRGAAVAASVYRRDTSPASAGPLADVRPGTSRPESWLRTTDVALALQVSERHARRLARTLDARRTRGGWLYPRQAVADYRDADHDNRRTAA